MINQSIVIGTLGKTFADYLDELIIDLGPKLQYSRRDMVENLGCANFIAAVKLTKVLKKLQVQSPAELHRISPMDLARMKGIGMTCLFVAMCILDTHSYDVPKWWGWKGQNDVRFSTLKHRSVRRAKRRAE